MTNEQKLSIAAMRRNGVGYKKIANTLGLSENTIKTVCRRNALTTGTMQSLRVCKNCGAPLTVCASGKPRLFCSDRCRIAWHRKQSGYINTVYNLTCEQCGRHFTSNGNKKQRFCSHTCYIAFRFGNERVAHE